MLFSIFLVCFILAVTYMQAIQGLTSAAITCVLVVISTVVSFGTYEAIAESVFMGFAPEYAHALALAAMFAVPLIVLRVLLDMWIPRSNLLPQIIDWVSGGVFGFFSAMLTSGVIACAIQMLPWGVNVSQTGEVTGGFFGYRRFDPTKLEFDQSELWLKPDQFAVACAGKLSVDTFSDSDPDDSFERRHSNLISDLAYAHALPLGVSRVVKSDDVKVTDVGQLTYLYNLVTGQRNTPDVAEPIDPTPDTGNVFVHVSLQISAEGEDVDKKKRFSPTSVRIVGTSRGRVMTIPATGVIDPDDPSRYIAKWKSGNREVQPVAGKVFLVPASNKIEVAFEVPEDFKPEEVRFKVGGYVPFTKSQKAVLTGEEPDSAPQASAPVRSEPTQTASSSNRSGSSGGGRVSGVKFKSSRFGSDLPMTFTAFQEVDTEIQSGILAQGVLTGKLDDQGVVKSDGPVTGLKVPSGKALLQLNVESLKAGSTLGRALNFSVQTLENYTVEDDQGNKILACGKYAVAKVGREKYCELTYYPTFESGGGRFKDFNKIKNQHFKKDYQLVYLFLLDKGRQAVRFSTGGNKRTIDLRSKNLVAE
ncbi:MAG: hypothetical protein DHS20C16_05760 [Phycisphaerae bacterium]|nr:MAG: hypothetical protein DHS20C16_05760 [Phycisphaerae bacterium]